MPISPTERKGDILLLARAPRELAVRYGLHPSRRRGQNFLTDKNVLRKILEAAELKGDETVLEIGPGFGVLTLELARLTSRVVTVEIDERLAAALQEVTREADNVEIVTGDALTAPLAERLPPRFILVANIPYAITSLLLERFLERGPRPDKMVLLMQKEVAERLTAKPGQMSVLAVAVQFFGKPEIVAKVSREAFWPRPEVDSAILRLTDIRPREPAVNPAEFLRLVRAGFAAKRKKLVTNLAAFLRRSPPELKALLASAGLKENARAQELSLTEWLTLFKALRSDGFAKRTKNR